MAKAVDLKEQNDLDMALIDTAELRWAPDRLRDRRFENLRPINIQIIVEGDHSSRFEHGNQWGFSFHRTRLFSIVMILLLALGTTYARTRYVCRSFKNEGRFYYGMDVDRCVGVLMKEPLASFESLLAKLDASY